MGKKIFQSAIVLICLAVASTALAERKFKEVASDNKHKNVVHVRQDGVNDVPVSNYEINHIISEHNINNIKLPEDSKISLGNEDIVGKNAFFRCKGTDSELIYVATHGQIYTLRIKPTKIGAQKIHLIGSVKNNISKLHGNKKEKLAVEIIKAAFSKGKLLERARESHPKKHHRLIKDIVIKEHRRYDFEDDQLTLNVYIVKLANSFKYPEFKVLEKNFLIPDLSKKPIGIALSRDYLTKNDYVRLFILGRN